MGRTPSNAVGATAYRADRVSDDGFRAATATRRNPMEQKLDAEPRNAHGKGGARKVRAAGRVPGVVYGHGADPLHVSVDSRELFHVLHTDAGANVLVDLHVDGQTILTMPREIQRDLLRGRFVHVDF